jgi:NAD(P)-dependent dehydrogenase (short-subunit alcohol dehydrogenase family)
VTEVLRAGVLAGVRVAVQGAGEFAGAVRSRVDALGAVAEAGDVVVWDGSAIPEPQAALDAAWDCVRPAAAGWIAGAGGQLVLLAPPPGTAGAEATRAGLETMARTLSIEWSRHAIRPVAILPGAATSPAEVAELVAFLASRAGAYYSGCAFTLA